MKTFGTAASKGAATCKIRVIRAIRVLQKNISFAFNYQTTNLTDLTNIHISLRSYFPIRTASTSAARAKIRVNPCKSVGDKKVIGYR